MSDDPVDEFLASGMNMSRSLTKAARALMHFAEQAKRRQAEQVREEAARFADQLDARENAAKAFYATTSTDAWLKAADREEVAKAVHGVHALAVADARFEESAAAMRGQLRQTHGVDLEKEWVATRDPDRMGQLTAQGLGGTPGSKAERADRDQARATETRIAAESAEQAADGDVVDAEYDTAVAREQRDAALAEAGLPAEAVKAKTTADRLNTQDPAHTARAAARSTKRRPKARKNLSTGKQAATERQR